MNRLFPIAMVVAFIALITACTDDEHFSTSSAYSLSFSVDTLTFDTAFNNTTTPTKSLWVYNRTDHNLRLSSVRLAGGTSTGFRVNVDGESMGQGSAEEIGDVEIRKKDSLRIYVDLQTPADQSEAFLPITDELVLRLESGVEQRIPLNAASWKAVRLRDVHISRDTTLCSPSVPVVVYGDLTVDSAATLTIGAGTTLYFHENAGLRVYGTVRTQGTADQPVTLRGDRLDHMFDYLPYDRTPGQWQGVHLYASSYGNDWQYTDLHSAYDGIVADSAALSDSKLILNSCTVHNNQGYGVWARNCRMTMLNTQITNALHDCLYVDGGEVTINNCTIGQFYPFDGGRGAAFTFTNNSPLQRLTVENSLITGYADDVVMGMQSDTTKAFHYAFNYCVLRTPRVTTADSVYFSHVIYENLKDTVGTSDHHFRKMDIDNFIYDFSLDSTSVAIGAANTATALPTDRLARPRDEEPDAGAYEYVKTD